MFKTGLLFNSIQTTISARNSKLLEGPFTGELLFGFDFDPIFTDDCHLDPVE